MFASAVRVETADSATTVPISCPHLHTHLHQLPSASLLFYSLSFHLSPHYHVPNHQPPHTPGKNNTKQYEDFVDLRLTEAEKFYPEGPAGGEQGALERAMTRGTSTAILRREAGDALIHSIDGFASAEAAKAPFGIEGTASDEWRKARQAREQRGSPSAGGGGEGVGADGGDGSEAEGVMGESASSSGDGAVEDDDIVGDVRAAAAEGAAAAAAAAEAVSAAAVAAAGGGARAEDESADGGGKGSEEGGEGAQQKKPILGSGPIWEEMKALAHSKRKPLKDIRRVAVQPGQVRLQP